MQYNTMSKNCVQIIIDIATGVKLTGYPLIGSLSKRSPKILEYSIAMRCKRCGL